MRKFCCWGLLLAMLFVGPIGCVTTVPPPSESVVTTFRAYHRELRARVAAGELTAGQAHDLFYARLEAAQPPLPGLESLALSRRQVAAQLETGRLTREQADSLLTDRESAMLRRWADMAAQDALEQREIQRLRDDYDEGLWQQKQIEQGEKVFRDRPRF